MDPDKNILNNDGDQGQVRSADTCSLLINISYFVLSRKIVNWENIFDVLREDDPLPPLHLDPS